MGEVWEIALPLLKMGSNQIAYDNVLMGTLAAVMIKLGHPLKRKSWGCPICVKDAKTFISIQHKAFMAKSRGGSSKLYKLKKHVVTVLGYAIDQDSCTDELAREMLKMSESYLAFFERFPENWKEDIKTTVEKPIKKSKPELEKVAE